MSVIKSVKDLVDKKDARGLKYIFVDSLDVDPTFQNYQQSYDYVNRYFPECWESHREGKVPLTSNQSEWKSRDYWDALKLDFANNPSKERFEHMRRVAPVVYAEKVDRLKKERATREKTERDANTQSSQKSTSHNKETSSNHPSQEYTKAENERITRKKKEIDEHNRKIEEGQRQKQRQSFQPVEFRPETFRMQDGSEFKFEPSKFQKFKAWIVTRFANLVDKITDAVQKWKDSKFKKFLLKLLAKAKKGLSNSKSLKVVDSERAEQLSEEADQIQQELNKLNQQAVTESFIEWCDEMIV